MKIVIKNKGKKEILKFPKKLNLEKYKTRLRRAVHAGENISGYSLNQFATKWFILPKGNALFKSYDKGKETREFRLLNELLCQELAKQAGIPCAVYEPSIYKGVNGLVTYNVLKEGERLISGRSLSILADKPFLNNSIQNYEDMFCEFAGMSRKELELITRNLYKQALFDLITFQTDRHANNVFFIQNENTRRFSPAPLIDNEFAFCGAFVEENLIDELPSPKFEVMYLQFANRLNMDMLSSVLTYEGAMKELLRVANRDLDLKQEVVSDFSKIDINKALENIEKMGVIPSEAYKEHVTALTKYSLSVFNEVFEAKTKQEERPKTNICQDDGMGM